ncbi:DUF6624 domain-containing protein [Streptomyces sp. NPDC048172]|uniref:DUF6624 domain-containing protein n=1 Tax=Streptomyces sp. NPDC048172 TaxID=3365505 RepID=UPI003710F690
MQQTPTDITTELRAMFDLDQASESKAHHEDIAERLAWRRLTTLHGDRLREILEAHGWPSDPAASEAAWVLAQHADHQIDVQRLALGLLEAAVEAGGAGPDGPRHLAFLRDRLAVNEGREQTYGTQIGGITDEGAPVPWPVADPAGMDARRAEVGIPPFDAYVKAHAPQGRPQR